MENKLSKIMVVFGIGIVFAVGVVLLLLMHNITPCQLESNEPRKMDKLELKNFVANDFDAIANLDAFLSYETTTTNKDNLTVANGTKDGNGNGNVSNEKVKIISYLPLGLGSICRETIDGKQKLGLEMNCTKLSFIFDENIKTGKINVDRIDINLLVPFNEKISCYIERPPISFDKSKHYYCDKLLRLPCKFDETKQSNETDTNRELYLSLRTFEFEINGEVESMKKGQFSKERDVCNVAKDFNKIK